MTKSPADQLPRDADQLRAQRSVIEYESTSPFSGVGTGSCCNEYDQCAWLSAEFVSQVNRRIQASVSKTCNDDDPGG